MIKRKMSFSASDGKPASVFRQVLRLTLFSASGHGSGVAREAMLQLTERPTASLRRYADLNQQTHTL